MTDAHPKMLFISYSSKDRDIVNELVRRLPKDNTYNIWYDRRLMGGQKWWDEILEKIRVADVFILALSDNYLASLPCQLERDYALALGKTIIPVEISQINYNRLPGEITERHISEYDGSSATISAIQSAVDTAASPPLPEPLPAPPDAPTPPLAYIRSELSRSSLPSDDQRVLLDNLRWHYTDNPSEAEETSELLTMLYQHKDVTKAVATAAEELDRTMKASSRLNTDLNDTTKSRIPAQWFAILGIIALIGIASTIILMTSGDDPTGNDNPDATEAAAVNDIDSGTDVETSEADVIVAEQTSIADEGSSAATNDTTSATAFDCAPGPFDVSFLYGGADSFVLLPNEESNLCGLHLRSGEISESLVESFPILSASAYLVSPGMCLRYIREGASPVLPRDCDPATSLQYTLPQVDVFWYESSSNRVRDFTVWREDTLIGLCSSAASRCTHTLNEQNE